jgi:hypothetical protein
VHCRHLGLNAITACVSLSSVSCSILSLSPYVLLKTIFHEDIFEKKNSDPYEKQTGSSSETVISVTVLISLPTITLLSDTHTYCIFLLGIGNGDFLQVHEANEFTEVCNSVIFIHFGLTIYSCSIDHIDIWIIDKAGPALN